MKNELDIVADLSTKLQQLGIPFMLTGSMALNYYAEPRFTRDIDFVLLLTPAEVPVLVSALRDEYYISEEDVMQAVLRRSIFNVIHTEAVVKADCIVRKESEHARAEFERRRPVTIGAANTFVVSKEDLILAKLSWARSSRSQIQMTDVKNLLPLGYDREYVDDWAEKLGISDLLKECRGE